MVLRDFEGAKLTVNGVYDAATLAAVNAFQAKYKSEILTPWGIGEPTGFVYLTTRKKINEMYCRNTRQFELTLEERKIIEQTRLKSLVAPQSILPTTISPLLAPLPASPPGEVGAGTGKGGTSQTAAVGEAVTASTSKKSFCERVFDFCKDL